MKLTILKEIPCRAPVTGLQDIFAQVTRMESAAAFSHRVNLIFADNRRLRRLNREFRAKDKTTDVLSFNIDGLGDAGGVFGEIYISVPYARQQAAAYGGTLRDELLRLFCHGLLHLFGYDHKRSSEARVMESLQERCLEHSGRGGRRRP
jgi:probable rRNA maturation factor